MFRWIKPPDMGVGWGWEFVSPYYVASLASEATANARTFAHCPCLGRFLH